MLASEQEYCSHSRDVSGPHGQSRKIAAAVEDFHPLPNVSQTNPIGQGLMTRPSLGMEFVCRDDFRLRYFLPPAPWVLRGQVNLNFKSSVCNGV
jgi:hypothetical protein